MLTWNFDLKTSAKTKNKQTKKEFIYFKSYIVQHPRDLYVRKNANK